MPNTYAPTPPATRLELAPADVSTNESGSSFTDCDFVLGPAGEQFIGNYSYALFDTCTFVEKTFKDSNLTAVEGDSKPDESEVEDCNCSATGPWVDRAAYLASLP